MTGRLLAQAAASIGISVDFADIDSVLYLRKQAALTSLLAYATLFGAMAGYFVLIQQVFWESYALFQGFRAGPMLASLPWMIGICLVLCVAYLAMFVACARPMRIKSVALFGLLLRFKRFRFAVDFQHLAMARAYAEQFGRKPVESVSVATTAPKFIANNPQFSAAAAEDFLSLVDLGQDALCGRSMSDFWKEMIFPIMFLRSKTSEDMLHDFGRELWNSFRVDRLKPVFFMPLWLVFSWLYTEVIVAEFRLIMGG